MQRGLRLWVVAGGCSLTLAAAVAPAGAATTIGQIGPPAGGGCGNLFDWIQPTVSSGNSYVVPNTGGVGSWTVTSWTTTASGPSERRTMKLFRKVADPATYEAVVHDGPQMLTAGGTAGNTFQTHLVVQAGDVLGFFTDTIGSCQSSTTDNFLLGGDGVHSLPDGQSEDFNSLSGGRLQIQAELTPTNDFTLARVRRDRRRGTAKLIFVLPNPGKLVGTGKGAKVSVAPADATGSVVAPNAGPSDLLVKAKGSRKATLDDTGKVTLKLSVTYIPTGGDPKKQPLKVKLKKT